MPRKNSPHFRPPSNRATDNETQLALPPPYGSTTASATPAAASLAPHRQSSRRRVDRISTALAEAAGTASAPENNEAGRVNAPMNEAAPMEPADGAAGLYGQGFDLKLFP